jgi:predicted nucleic acid-binding protein
MRSPTFLTDPKLPLVADSSTIINLIATGCAPTIIRAVPNPIVVVDVIPGELDTGRQRGRVHADRLQQELVAAGHVEIVALSDAGWLHFETLVAGPAQQTLDDGEAATIAYAVERGAVAIIDEKKGTRICASRFPGLGVVSTVDVLLHPEVRNKLGDAAFSDAVYAALRDARMAVFPRHLDDILGIIGLERAAQCPSLPKRFRNSVPILAATEADQST